MARATCRSATLQNNKTTTVSQLEHEVQLHVYVQLEHKAYTLWVKKKPDNSLVCNFAKRLPIFKILVLLYLTVNLQWSHVKKFCQTLIMSLYYY